MTEQEIAKDIKDKAIARGAKDFLFFCRYFLPNYFNLAPGSFHRDLCKIPFNDKDWNVIVVPRHHGKSTIFSFALPIWLACYNKELRFPILIISETSALSEKWLKLIKTEFEGNEILIDHFGSLVGQTWTSTNIALTNGTEIVSRGAGQQARGWHWKIVICDDLEGNESNRSELQLDYLRDWFDRELFYTLEATSRVYYIGTLISPNCHIMDLVKKAAKEGNWGSYFLRAYADGVEKEGNEIFPAKWSHASLQKMKSNNPFAFAMEMMNEPVPDSDKRFKPEWFRFYDSAPEGLRIFTTIDPTISNKKRADKSAIITCGVASDGSVYVLDVYNAINDPYVLVEEIFRINKTFAPFKIGIEVVVFQKMLKIYLEEKARERGIYLPIEELKCDTKTTKQLRIMGLIPYFADGKILLKHGQYSLIQQLREFSPNQLNMKDDAIDALAYQIQLWLKPGYTSNVAKMSGEEWLRAMQKRSLENLFKEEEEGGRVGTTGYKSNFYAGT